MVEWDTDLPEGWNQTRLGWTADVFSGYTFDSSYFNKEEGEKVVRIRDVVDGDTNTRYNGDTPDGYWISDGDILVGMDGDFHVGVWKGGDALLNQRVACIRADSEIESRFIRYALPAPIQVIHDLTRSTTVKHLSIEELRSVRIPQPPEDLMHYIVSFLDEKVSQIEELVKQLHALQELIEERRRRVIKSCATTGLSPNTALDDTGVEWFGELPDHWDVVRTRFVAALHSGHTPSKSNDEYWEDADIPWVSLADSDRLRHNDYIRETEKYTNEKGLANSSAHILPEGTVVFTRDATVGLCSIMERPMAVSQHIVGWVCGPRILPEYLLNVLKSMDQEFDRLTRGSTISTIGMHDIESFKTPLPPLEEQREIVDHIETETERLGELIDRVEETIDLLEEKRQALITKAVTGQIDLSDWQPPDKHEATQ